MPRGGRCPHRALGRGACRYRGSSRARWFRRPRGSGRSPRPVRWRAPRRGRRSDRGEGSGRGKFARSQYRLAVEGEMIGRPVTCLVIVPWLAVSSTLDLPTDFRYLDPQETDIVLRAWGNPPGRETLDRKSTRLNSSHGYISYAVFCLKKKKTKI